MNIPMFELYANYNLRMNKQIYTAARKLKNEEYNKNMGAFFGSINHTLNHIAVGDIFWLKRFGEHEELFQSLEPIRQLSLPQSLETILFYDLKGLFHLRKLIDRCIVSFVQELTELDINSNLTYTNSKGVESNKHFCLVLMHMFNHQTHHRGQVSTLFSQLGVDVGVTDMIVDVPEIDVI
ncbi:DinB family protein [Marinicellulosiphila megalodicopiae]|uniref:DinB family protein n=1 Tax=Marinicellulosiphila megalodicopiae TaxID=2724896 RepID=UPI003BB1A6E8